MPEPKLLAAAELAAIRERAAKDGRFTQSGWTNRCMADRRAMLAHIDALALVADYTQVAGELLCTHCGVRIHSPEEACNHACREQDLPLRDEAAQRSTS